MELISLKNTGLVNTRLRCVFTKGENDIWLIVIIKERVPVHLTVQGTENVVNVWRTTEIIMKEYRAAFFQKRRKLHMTEV